MLPVLPVPLANWGPAPFITIALYIAIGGLYWRDVGSALRDDVTYIRLPQWLHLPVILRDWTIYKIILIAASLNSIQVLLALTYIIVYPLTTWIRYLEIPILLPFFLQMLIGMWYLMYLSVSEPPEKIRSLP